ncbi:isoleucine--tRNA ligase [Thermovirga lienii]|jgi:isoleucyl-tRNA synthetase|uniref:isoleucine--tRNA ligase n=1 Tax=Thermovirga lienii TaxID=336261 RepID=UPI000ED2E80A|nr:isoleucyl-tRNA synthetase [Thermovirga sp.]MDN5367934.1 isoleucyl-tRNA synthetase [Thermovirga sp.]HCD71142.1 isoleucine--tRNA ligase [Thermovirga lienii]
MPEDYKNTLNLPQTSFPMRANLAKKEPELLRFWNSINLYEKLKESHSESERFVLHDGPPYANGNIHIGTAFNKILKDFIPKYKWMKGYFAPYVPGWDTHGLPIELRVLKEKKIDKDKVEPAKLREYCMEYAQKYIDIQRSEFRRLGVLGDWDNPYITYKSQYEAAQIGVFADMVERGLVYKGKKPVFWCIDCQTALAAAEIEYEDESSPSIYVAYPFKDCEKLAEELKDRQCYTVIWTTTPWTLPASMAVAVHPDYSYSFVESEDGRVFLLAEELKSAVEKDTGIRFTKTLLTVKGRELELKRLQHPFYDREVPMVLADYVGLDQGTGCVHTAPGHGIEDFETGVKYGLDVLNPVDDKGFFVANTPLVGGLSLEEGAKKVLSVLSESGRLLGKSQITHSYPHCWRCKKPVIFRATEQWFVSVDSFREKALNEIDKVEWVPDWGRDRIANMVRDRSDWCISRQRVWGVPIPVFYCEECGCTIATPDRIRRVQAKVEEKGSNCWWELSPAELLEELAVCPECGGKELRKETDIMDVWFDSGCSHVAVLETRPELKWPADLYLEGSDQHRGWFQTSLLTSVATRDEAPYKSVLTHGFIVDGEGRKMSKSLGNVIAPQEIINKYGADILRLWVASTDYRNDVRISENILKNLVESYRRIRNTARFLLGNLYDFEPAKDSVNHERLEEMDKWIVSRLQSLVKRVTKGFDEYAFHLPTYMIHHFCVNDLSAFYLDVSKDRLYTEKPNSHKRRSCQTALWEILMTLTKVLSPILSFTAEEIWQEMKKIDGSLEESVFMASWPQVHLDLVDEELESKWARILEVRAKITKGLEMARSQGLIGHPLEAQVVIEGASADNEDIRLLTPEDWAEILIVSGFSLEEEFSRNVDHIRFKDEDIGIQMVVAKADGMKCPRCWKFSESVAEKGLCERCYNVLQER